MASADPGQTAAQMSTFFAEALDGANGSRMRQFSRNAFVIAAWHGLTIDQSLDLLLDDDYREAALARFIGGVTPQEAETLRQLLGVAPSHNA